MSDSREDRLRGVVEAYRNAPFQWGVHDCVLFAARCVDAQLDTRFQYNIPRDYQYTGPLSALRLIIEAGGWEKIVGRYLGKPVRPEELKFGDVVLGHGNPPFESTILMGVCDEEFFMAPDTNGLAWIPMVNAIMGWRLSDIPRPNAGAD